MRRHITIYPFLELFVGCLCLVLAVHSYNTGEINASYIATFVGGVTVGWGLIMLMVDCGLVGYSK